MQMCGARAAGREEPWVRDRLPVVRLREDTDQTPVC